MQYVKPFAFNSVDSSSLQLEEKFPALSRFKLQRGANRICAQIFNNARTYENNKDKPETYIGARSLA